MTRRYLTEREKLALLQKQEWLCAIEGCGKPALTRGWCKAHYQRWWKTGNPISTATRHGHTRNYTDSATYRAWVNMNSRCRYSYVRSYHRYGGRGITVCERWLGFKNFLADMGEKPPGMTLERVNTDGNYEPGNCRWATVHDQSRNKCTNVWVSFNGSRMIAADVARLHGIDNKTFNRRIYRGLSAEEAAAMGPACARAA